MTGICVAGRWTSLSLLAAVLALVVALPAAAEQVSIEGTSVGIHGEFKVGHWTRVVVSLSAPQAISGKLALITADGEGLSARYVDADGASVKVHSTTEVERFVRFGTAHPNLTVEFIAEDGAVTRREFAARDLPQGRASTSEMVLVVGQDMGVSAALRQRLYRIKRATHVVKIGALNELPTTALGYDGIDLVVMTTSELSASQLEAPGMSAMRDWLLTGGRAVISCGRNSPLLFGSDGHFAALAPGTFERVASLRKTAALEAFAGSTQRLATETRLEMSQFADPRGQIVTSEETSGTARPLIINYAAGFGQISLITVDLDQPPLADWSGRAKILARLMAFHQPGETGKSAGSKQTSLPAQLGYNDLAGQLRNALDQFPGVRLIAFSWVAGLIAAYILLIGPVDYFFVRFGLRRMQATWLTLTVVSVSFVALAWWIDARRRSDALAMNQASIIDIDAGVGLERGIAWSHVYSPRTTSLALQPRVHIEEQNSSAALVPNLATMSWQGLPGAGLGGLDGRSPPVLFDASYDVVMPASGSAARPAMASVPIQTASTKAFVAEWSRSAVARPQMTFQATSDGLITGKFTFDYDYELEDGFVLYDRFLFKILGTIKRGRVIEITPSSTSRNVLYHLTQKQVIDSKDIVTPWNPRSTDVPRILEIMMLHEVAGGDNYTGLTQRFFGRLDLSDHLGAGQALLIGRSHQSPIAWQGEPLGSVSDERSWTMVRVVIPVRPAPPAP
jgi:hypothetical protein